jgi:hypothetical protein
MDVRITVETTFDNGEKRTHQLDGISRPYRVTCPDGIGLRLEVERRRMRWSPRGAHRVAVTRAAVLDGRLTVANRKRAA